jgi:hypothetical protein
MKKLVVAFALAAFSLMAQAQNLVTNFDFENGLTGWTQSALPQGSGEEKFRGVVTSSSNSFYSNGTTIQTSLSQPINTAAGTLYDLSFQLRRLPAQANLINYSKVVFGNYAYEQPGFNVGLFTTFTYKGLLAGAGPTLLTFTASSNNSFVHLDNVSVQVSAVPEPETTAMLLLGLGLIGYVTARRRKT